MSMKNTLSVALLLFGVLMLTNSCKHEAWVPDGFEPNPDDTLVVSETCDPNTVYFENDVLPIFQSSCAYAGCHDANTQQDGVRLDNYQGVISTGDIEAGDPEHSEVYERITDSDPQKRMPPPPNSPLNADQINTIRLWIEQGAKNNACVESNCDSTGVSYATDVVANVLDVHCMSCHSGNAAAGNGVQMNTHAQVAALANSGTLLGVIAHQPGYPAMPLGGTKLDDCKIGIIRNWINEGAQNN